MYGPVHPMPAGTLLAEQGVNVTTPVDASTEYLPWFVMSRVVALQFDAVNGDVAAAGHNRTDVDDNAAGDDAESLLTAVKSIVFPCSANPLSLRATGGSGICGVRVDVAV